jgi:peroxiredoxin Q/BCP
MRVSLSWLLSVCALLVACAGVERPDGQTGLLPSGSDAPALVTKDHQGAAITLRAGVPTLVYFYPKDGTPGCTKEACALRDAWQSYERLKLRVIGVSSDSNERHRAFAAEHGLPFPLVADEEHVWSQAFGVGTFAGLDSRVSFLLGPDNKVRKVYEDVDPGVHADQVLRDAVALGLVKEP